MAMSTFAFIFGFGYLVVGLLGLVPVMLAPPPMDAPPTHFTLLYGYLFGVFPVNIVHSALNIIIGAWGLTAWSGRANSATYARVLTVLFGVLAVMGMLPVLNTTFGLMPLNGHDIWLHALTALVAAYVGWREPAGLGERRHLVRDRRQRMMPVAYERRFGLADRREHLGGMSVA